MSPERKRFGVFVGPPIVIVTAVLVVVAGRAVGGGASQPPLTETHWEPVPSISEEDRARIQAENQAMLDQMYRQTPELRPSPQDASPTPASLAAPSPAVIRIGEASIEIPEGMKYIPETVWTGNPFPGRAASGLIYSDKNGTSRLGFYADTGEITAESILSPHADLFAPIADWLNSLGS
jgi:hypothetical protein